jgi:hypothetical protein
VITPGELLPKPLRGQHYRHCGEGGQHRQAGGDAAESGTPSDHGGPSATAQAWEKTCPTLLIVSPVSASPQAKPASTSWGSSIAWWPRQWPGRWYLQRWPSDRALNSIRAKIRQRTDRRLVGIHIETIVDGLNPVLRGWGNYFRRGNSARKFNHIDNYPCRSGPQIWATGRWSF